MREEISAAVVFLARLIEKGENCNHDQLEHFKLRLSEILVEKFENHWFPEKPDKGQGYRCIRLNGVSRRDPSLEKAALASGIKYEDIKLPCELTIWVDPNEVCCRFGENKGSFCTLASFSDKEGSETSGSDESEEPVVSDNSGGHMKRSISPSDLIPAIVAAPPSPALAASPIPKDVEQVNTNLRTNWRGRKNSGQGAALNSKQRAASGGARRSLGSGFHHHHVNPWYNLIAPPWLPPSPPPYHHLRHSANSASQPASSKWYHPPNHHRHHGSGNHYQHWAPPKSTLKV